MNSYSLSPWIIILMINSIWTIHAQNNNFIVTDFGGIADGKTDNKPVYLYFIVYFIKIYIHYDY